MASACDGVSVLDLTRGPVGGIATMILADAGARVLKIEPPGGDPYRALAAAPLWLRGKESRVLNLHQPADRATLHDLTRAADVVVANYRPGQAERLSADADTLRALNDRLVYCSITGFGPRGPYAGYRGYEGVVAAKSGRMQLFAGQPRRAGPVYSAVPLASHGASQAAVQGILAALLLRQRTGRGQLVETSLLQGLLPYDMAGLVMQQFLRRFPAQFPVDPFVVLSRQPTLQYQPVRTSDGRWIQLGNLIEHHFHTFLAVAGLSHIYADPRFASVPVLTESAREELRDIIIERMRERTADQWMEEFVANGNVAAEMVQSTHEALQHQQMLHNGDILHHASRRYGDLTTIGPLAHLSETPLLPSTHIADLDEWRAIDPSSSEAEAVSAEPPPATAVRAPRHPLEGVTVLEFATIIAAPLACAILGDLGARVIKVEPVEGDPLRTLGNGVSTIKTTASKESLCVDLKAPDAAAIVRELVTRADLLVHNYRPGVAERLGIGYDQVRAINPAIVYVEAMGYGTDGPHARRPCAHPLPGAAVGGALWQAGSGWPGDCVDTVDEIKEAARQFTRANETNPDPTTSLVIATAALLGLHARALHGIGQRVTTDMFLANAYANADDFCDYEGKPPRPLVDADVRGLHALYRLYPARDGWVFLACPTDAEWGRFCHAVGHPQWIADARFTDATARRDHDADVGALLDALFLERDAAVWEVLLTDVDVACVVASAAMPGGFWDRDPHVYDNGFVHEVEHLRWGPMWRHGPLWSFRDTPARIGAGTLAGQHTVQLLRELGYADDAIRDLTARRVVGSESV